MSSIKGKIIAVVAATLFAGVAVIGYQLDRNHRSNLELTSEESLRSSRKVFENLRKDSTQLMAAVVECLLLENDINAALASRDREKLYAMTQPIFEGLKKRHGLTHWNYWELEAPGADEKKGLTSFLRVATPTSFGDRVERAILGQGAQKKTFVDGLDLGYTGFALRIIHPVRHKDALCGYFEIGTEIGSFFDSMKLQTGSEYGLMLIKDRLDVRKWEASRAVRGLRNNWADAPDLVLAKNTFQDEAIFSYSGNLGALPDEGAKLGFIRRSGQVFSRSAFPLYDAGGTKAGVVFVLNDVTKVYSAARQTLLRTLITIVVIMVAAGFAMVWLFQRLIVARLQRLIVARLQRLIGIATRVVGGDFQLKVVPSAQDEIGQFEALFEQFRSVFVDLVESLEACQSISEKINPLANTSATNRSETERI